MKKFRVQFRGFLNDEFTDHYYYVLDSELDFKIDEIILELRETFFYDRIKYMTIKEVIKCKV